MADHADDYRDPDEGGRLGRLIRLQAEEIRRAGPESADDVNDMPPPAASNPCDPDEGGRLGRLIRLQIAKIRAREKSAHVGNSTPGGFDD